MSTTGLLLDWVKEHLPVLESRVAETHAAAERGRVAGEEVPRREPEPKPAKARRAA